MRKCVHPRVFTLSPLKFTWNHRISENTEKQLSEAINSIPSTWVRKFHEDLNMEDWFLDIDAYISKDYRDHDGKKKESEASINLVKEMIEANYFENTIEIQMHVVMILCRLNISDLESKTLHHDSDMSLNFFLILNSGLLNLIVFWKL